MKKLTEADLARYIVGYFQDLHWDVYQEVQLSTQSKRADIVVTQGRLVGVCECKQSLGLPVLEQAFNWKTYAHFVWIATWHRRPGPFIRRLMKDYGFGHLEHYENSAECNTTREGIKPTLLRCPPELDTLRGALRPQQRSGFAQAGANSGGHFTPSRTPCGS